MINPTQSPAPLSDVERARAEGMMTALGVMEALLGGAVRLAGIAPGAEAFPGQKKAVCTLLETINEATLKEAARQMGIIRKQNTAVEARGGLAVGITMGIDLDQFRRFVANGRVTEAGRAEQ